MTNARGQGRKKTPTALVGIDGAKMRKSEPKPARVTVRMPRGMTPRAKEQWRRLAPDLIRKGVLTAWDADAFMLYCESWSQWEEARRHVLEHGVMLTGQKGNLVKNPAVQIQRDAAEMIRKIGALFGLSPSDRAGLSVVMPKQNGLREFL